MTMRHTTIQHMTMRPKPTMLTRRRALIFAGVVALLVVMVVLHLTGAIGANTHQ
jgi:hypothetical protein